jgi:hypothetical protein
LSQRQQARRRGGGAAVRRNPRHGRPGARAANLGESGPTPRSRYTSAPPVARRSRIMQSKRRRTLAGTPVPVLCQPAPLDRPIAQCARYPPPPDWFSWEFWGQPGSVPSRTRRKGGALQVEILIVGRNPGVADQHRLPAGQETRTRRKKLNLDNLTGLYAQECRAASPDRRLSHAGTKPVVFLPASRRLSCNERAHGADDCDPVCNERAPSCNERGPDPESRLQSAWARRPDVCDPGRG